MALVVIPTWVSAQPVANSLNSLADSARIAYNNCRANQRAHFVNVGLGPSQSLMANVRGPAEERPGNPKGYHLSFGENPLINQAWYIITLATEIALLAREAPTDSEVRRESLEELRYALLTLIRLDAALPPAGDGLLARHDLTQSVLESWEDSLVEASAKLVNLKRTDSESQLPAFPAFSQDDLLHLTLGLLVTKSLVSDSTIQRLVKQIAWAFYQNLAEERLATKAEPLSDNRTAELWLNGPMLLLENKAIASSPSKLPFLAIGGAVGGFRPVLENAFSTLLDTAVRFADYLEIRRLTGVPFLENMTPSRIETGDLVEIWRDELPVGELNLTYKLSSKVLAKTLWRNKGLLMNCGPMGLFLGAYGGFGLALSGRVLHQVALRPIFEKAIDEALYSEDGGHMLMTAGVLEGSWDAADFYMVDFLALPKTKLKKTENQTIPSRAYAYVLLNELLNLNNDIQTPNLAQYQQLLRGMPLDGRPEVLRDGSLKGGDWAAKHRWIFWNALSRGNIRDPGARNGVAYTIYYNLLRLYQLKIQN